nr:MAG TPA: Methyltransferase domain [Caudoviricetes sp.]
MIADYNPYLKTAITRGKLSKPMKLLKDKDLLQGNILDFGCGKGEDVILLQREKYNILGYDEYNPAYSEDTLKDSLDTTINTITCNYVFNTIPNLTEHEGLVKLFKALSDRISIYISVRADTKAIKDNWIFSEVEQGYWTPRGSFQRFYNEIDVDCFFGDVEYIHNDNDFKLFKII